MPENKRYEVADYEDLARQNHRGLVAMRFLKHAMPYNEGDVAGFKPTAAKKLHDDGDAEPVDAAGMKSDHSPERKDADTAEAKRLDAIEIPMDVMSGHALTRIKVAKAISGGEVANDAAAQEIINRETKRRAGGAVTTADLKPAKPGQVTA